MARFLNLSRSLKKTFFGTLEMSTLELLAPGASHAHEM